MNHWLNLIQQYSQAYFVPVLIAAVLAYFGGAYMFWRAGKRQFWDTNIVFSLYAFIWLLAVLGGLSGGLMGALIKHGGVGDVQVWLSGFSLVGAYAVAGIGLWYYLRRVHYPFWRIADALVFSLAITQAVMVSGWSLYRWSLSSLPLAIGLWGMAGIVYWVRHRTWAEGRKFGAIMAASFAIIIADALGRSSWQDPIGLRELVTNIGGLVVGVGLIIVRTSSTTRKNVISDLPRGVSQGFRDTFNRAFSSHKPS
jgi:hypothetical protein